MSKDLLSIARWPLTYFAGDARGRGLIRIETDCNAPVAGLHIASMTRSPESEAYAQRLIACWNACVGISDDELADRVRGVPADGIVDHDMLGNPIRASDIAPPATAAPGSPPRCLAENCAAHPELHATAAQAGDAEPLRTLPHKLNHKLQSLVEAARSLGCAQYSDDKDAAKYWTACVDQLVASMKAQPAPEQAAQGVVALADETLLSIARETGLRSCMHAINATEAKQILRRYVDALAAAQPKGAQS